MARPPRSSAAHSLERSDATTSPSATSAAVTTAATTAALGGMAGPTARLCPLPPASAAAVDMHDPVNIVAIAGKREDSLPFLGA